MFSAGQKRWRLFSAFGIPVYADPGALILLVLILVLFSGAGPAGMLAGLLIGVIAFASIYAHELAHAFAIRKFGYGKSQILFSALGGLTQWRGRPTHGHSIQIALAGPAASLLLAGLAALLLYGLGWPSRSSAVLYFLVHATFLLNLLWGIFNLLPIHPMDGGKVTRSALQMRMPAQRALRLSLQISGAVGVALLFASVMAGYIFVALVVGFLLLQNWNEWQANAN